jgi:hypothetical protein
MRFPHGRSPGRAGYGSYIGVVYWEFTANGFDMHPEVVRPESEAKRKSGAGTPGANAQGRMDIGLEYGGSDVGDQMCA